MWPHPLKIGNQILSHYQEFHFCRFLICVTFVITKDAENTVKNRKQQILYHIRIHPEHSELVLITNIFNLTHNSLSKLILKVAQQ